MAAGEPFGTQPLSQGFTAELSTAGFEDVREIGRGGFGVVYRCRQPSLDRTVAVKILSADLDEDNLTRFFREQRAIGRLGDHPNVVSALQVGLTDSGRPYLVMTYHPQGNLEERIRRDGPLSVEETLRLMVRISGALETAHQAGMLHRDFGIAHVVGEFHTATGAEFA